MIKNGSVEIKSIDKKVVNQICSGQVILTLSTAVKELVENSIDANATSIQIRLKEYGAETIEVSDNGCGVEEKNFQALTLKHYTSKISDFDDVASVETFGFRGEALSSLCTLSKVGIITRHKDSLIGTKLKFDHNGIITECSKIARQIGTTVTLENIFCTLPVRHKEFLRNIKKEFSKMCNVLFAYGLLSKSISIVCTNQVSNKKLTVMETMGETVKSNITQIFGAKQSQNLLEIEKSLPEDGAEEESPDDGNQMKLKSVDDIELEGFISSCVHGCGRSSSDRQFYYINSRPVDNVKVAKLVNDIYHQYNPHQYPFVVLNMKILMTHIDVNVTPDKRLIFMKNEKLLLSIIEASLHKMFKNLPGTLKLQNIGLISSTPVEKSVFIKENPDALSPLDKLKQFRSRSYVPIKEKSAKERTRNTASAVKSFPSVRDMFVKIEPDSRANNSEDKMDELSQFEEVPGKSVTGDSSRSEERPSPIGEVTDLQAVKVEIVEKIEEVEASENVSSLKKRKPEVVESNGIAAPDETAKRFKTDDGMTGATKNNRKSVTINFSLDDIRESVRKRRTETPEKEKIKFYSKINPSENQNAEKELMKELHKDSFKRMVVIGQFNLGFIIARLDSDLFIIDQHATDEKYNFETLQRTTKIQTQKFVVPQNLNLTVEKEELLLHHSDAIRQNGFDFTFDADERPTNRVKLTAVPLSKNWIFGREDIDEMLFLLENAPDGKICRPSRLRDMFASRACRKSVMIGTPLNQFEMRRLINHMGEIEQPWNCPHGRPTIRHLINVNMIRRSD